MKHPFTMIGLVLVLLSSFPLFLMAREDYIQNKIMDRYEVAHSYTQQGWSEPIDVQSITVNDIHIELQEIPTGKKATRTMWDADEGVEAGDIVQLQILVDGKAVSSADEIWLSNRDRGGRYWSWLDVLRVKDKKTQTERIAIVQRLTDDDEQYENRAWKIVWIDVDGTVTEEKMTYAERSDNPLGVRLTMFSGTTLMSMGYYSDIFHYYPSLLYPILYPFGTVILGLLLMAIGVFRQMLARRNNL